MRETIHVGNNGLSEKSKWYLNDAKVEMEISGFLLNESYVQDGVGFSEEWHKTQAQEGVLQKKQ